MTQLSTRMTIQDLGDDDVDLIVEYDYWSRSGELLIYGAEACIGDERKPVWHLLSMRQRDILEDSCRDDYVDRMDGARETRYEARAY